MINTLLVAIFISALAFLLLVLYKRKPQIRLFSGDKYKKELEKLCFGDKGAAARLMRMELQKKPGISEQEAYRRAVAKLRRHRT